MSPRARVILLGAFVCLSLNPSGVADARHASRPQPPPPQQAPKPSAPSAPQQPTGGDAKRLGPAAPAAPQSTHYPILLLVQGSDQAWSVRIGLRGPERLDRNGYPPIPLEPAEVVRDGSTDTWTYHAKDMQTGAVVAVHITRAPCADSTSGAKWAFKASLEHAQIGSAEGCARVATELFPKINNQPTDDDDTKDKPTPPTITHFKPPFAVAYLSASGKLIMKRGTVARAIPGKGYQPTVSHDGKRLLFTVDQNANERTIFLYDWTSGKVTELLSGGVQQAFWSPDDATIAFRKFDGTKWQLWTMPIAAVERAALVYPGDAVSLQGWADAHTVLLDDLQTFSWIGDDGTVKQTLTGADLYGKDQFRSSSANTVRIHPLNGDLLLVSAELAQPLPAAGSKSGSKESANQPGQAFFLYEIQSQRRVVLNPPNMSCSLAEWSRDGLQIFFTCREPSSTAMTIYRMFWDGTSQIKVQEGSNLVIGQ